MPIAPRRGVVLQLLVAASSFDVGPQGNIIQPREEIAILARESGGIYATPIVIINFNIVFYLQKQIATLRAMGYHNIFILDNNSTYSPLLSFYQSGPAWVVLLQSNSGNMAFWNSGILKFFADKRFVVTESDLLLSDDCPDDWLQHLSDLLDEYEVSRVGAAVNIVDLPDHFAFKAAVLRDEATHWEPSRILRKDVYNTSAAGTLALYREGVGYRQWYHKAEDAVRIGGPYSVRRMLWYENVSRLPEDVEVALHSDYPYDKWWRAIKVSREELKGLKPAAKINCFDGIYTEDFCCDTTRGLYGSVDCWTDANLMYNKCCPTEVVLASEEVAPTLQVAEPQQPAPTSPRAQDRRAYATVAVGAEPWMAANYVMGAIVMGMSLQRVESPYPLLVLVERGDAASVETLRNYCPKCIPLEVDKFFKDAQFHQWVYAYTRLRLWDIDGYDIIVAMDSDILIVENVDDLFDYPTLTMSRNRCGLCCTHALGGHLPFVSGTMVLRPDKGDFQKLVDAMAYSWLGEHELIQKTLPVASWLAPDFDVVASTTLASCGCRPEETNGTYVSRLPAVPGYQNVVDFNNPEVEYFPGVHDAMARTVHLNNPKPWDIRDPSEAPCGVQFYKLFRQDLSDILKPSHFFPTPPYKPIKWEYKDPRDDFSCASDNRTEVSLRSLERHYKELCEGTVSELSIRHEIDSLLAEISENRAGFGCVRRNAQNLAPVYLSECPAARRILRYFHISVLETPSCNTSLSCSQLVLRDAIVAQTIVGNPEIAEEKFLPRAKKIGMLWTSVWQVPLMYLRLTARPSWNLDNFPVGSIVPALVHKLEAYWRTIDRELKRALRLDPTIEVVAYPELANFSGNWTKVMLYDGDMGFEEFHRASYQYRKMSYPHRRLHPMMCRHFPFTCSLIENHMPGIVHRTLPYLQYDQEQVNFFSLQPGSNVAWHSAAQNNRLTIHVCLSGCGGRSRLYIGTEQLEWRRGKVIIFDDSFTHRVSTDPDAVKRRWILHIMVNHPEIETPDSFYAVNHLSFAVQ